VDGDSQTNGPFGTGEREGLVLPPWEQRDRYGFLNSIYQTIKEVLFSPVQFFERMPSQVSLAQPLFFAMVLGAVGAFFMWMWSLTFSSVQMFFDQDWSELLKEPFIYGIFFGASPVLTIIDVFISAGVTHLCLMVLGGNRLGFEATFRVVAYAQAVSILTLLPFCGVVILEFWFLALVIIGLYKMHDTDLWRAILAVFLPLLLCLFSCGGLVLFLLSVGAISG